MRNKLISVISRINRRFRNFLMKFTTGGGNESLSKSHHMTTHDKNNRAISKLGFSLTLKFLILFIIFTPVKIYAAASVLLDTATVIPDGMKLCDSANKFCTDITLNPAGIYTFFSILILSFKR